MHFMASLVSDRLRAALAHLPRAERRVAHEILGAYPVAGLETVARLAARASVSGPTVVRLVNRLGFEGYPDFQNALINELEERTASPLLQYERLAPASAADWMAQTKSVLVTALEQSLGELDRASFDRFIDALTDPRQRVVTAGGRFTQLVAHSLAAHLGIVRPNVSFLAQDQWVPYLMNVQRNDAVVIFDVRRYQRTTVEFGQQCAQRGASVLLVTDPWMSPLAMDATAILQVSVESPSPFDSLVPAFAVVEALLAEAFEHLGPAAKDRMRDYDELWDQRGFGMTKATGSEG
jgi:DNA-binding MurR/RpiR family transcriptional regulator